MASKWISWKSNFHDDTNIEQFDESCSYGDPVATRCSFGRGKRREEMTIPRLPKCLILTKTTNASGIGRGLSKRSYNSVHSTKPGNGPKMYPSPDISVSIFSDKDTSALMLPEENLYFEDDETHKEPIFFDQHSNNKGKGPAISTAPKVNIDFMNKEDFPDLVSSMKAVSIPNGNSESTQSFNNEKSRKKKKHKK